MKTPDFAGVTQDVMVNGELVHKGRECRARLEMILPHVRQGSTVLDVGSHVGYFGIELARARGCKVDSYEANNRFRSIQRWAVKANGVEDLVKVKGDFDPAAMGSKKYDVILLLAVLHYCPGDFLKRIAAHGKKIIIEFPRPEETTALYHDLIVELSPFEDHLRKVFGEVALIGVPDAPYMPGVKRGMWLCRR
jgi:protein-L-isoaspartate O-methyltransferase